MKRLILASASPRRREFLERFGIPFAVAASGCDETMEPGIPPAEGARRVAERKALTVAQTAGAEEMLRSLSGRWHTVVTGVALCGGGRCESLSVATRVHFRPLTEAEVRWYVATGEPMDKAGAYALQGAAAAFVDRIRGSHSNVIGLPVAETLELLARAGYAPWSLGKATDGR